MEGYDFSAFLILFPNTNILTCDFNLFLCRKKGEVKKRGGGGFTKVCSLSPELQEFTGVPELARTEVSCLVLMNTQICH